MQVDEHAAVAHGPDAAGNPHSIFGFGARCEPGVMPLELARLMRALEAVGVRIDPERLETVALAYPDRAQRVFGVPHWRSLSVIARLLHSAGMADSVD